MSIHAITGVMGSGKSYEAVSEKIVPALRDESKRRVITNIEGLNFQAIADHVGRPLADIQARLIPISYERVSEPNFWFSPEDGQSDSLVQPGDLVVLDEIWRYFNRGLKLPDDAMKFMRMHRHYVGVDSGLTCDIVLVNQSIRGIHSDIRDIIELQLNCRKLKVLGTAKTYQVFVIEASERKASHNYIRRYDPAIFALYSSYGTSGATEAIDKRQSVFTRPFFKYGLPLAVLGIAGGLYFAVSSFKQMGHKPVPAVTAPGVPVPSAPPASLVAGAPVPSTGNQVPSAASSAFSDSDSEWRVVALYRAGDLPVVVLTDSKGRFRTMTPGSFSRGAGSDISVGMPAVEARGRATPWSGPAPTYSGSSGLQAPSMAAPK